MKTGVNFPKISPHFASGSIFPENVFQIIKNVNVKIDVRRSEIFVSGEFRFPTFPTGSGEIGARRISEIQTQTAIEMQLVHRHHEGDMLRSILGLRCRCYRKQLYRDSLVGDL